MYSDLKRKYKERLPEQSVEDIVGIFRELKIDTEITDSFIPMPQVYSHRVEITDDGVNVFGTNGKGRTEMYSLASAYAELIERVQNGLFSGFDKEFLFKLQNEFGFVYYPDEKYITKEEFMKLPEKVVNDCVKYKGKAREKFIEDFFCRIETNGRDGVLGIPFYDSAEERVVYIPYNLIMLGTGSNGMAAGNTVAEATFQALCELMERWCASKVFYEQLTPPDVPDSFLEKYSAEYETIEKIRDKGYEVKVKDFSAGLGMPSLGLLVIDRERGKYQLNIGSESHFGIALSRCLTEIYQGFAGDREFKDRFLDIPEAELEMFTDDSEKSQIARRREFQNFTKDNSGRFPQTLFGSKPDYSFDARVFEACDSYEEEVKRYSEKFHGQGFNVYIRDTSFLGFPTVYVYIPEVSFMGKKSVIVDNSRREKFPLVEIDKSRELFYKTRQCNKEELEALVRTLECCKGGMLFDLFSISLSDESDHGDMPVLFFVSLLRYKLQHFPEAYKAFKEFYGTRKEKLDYYDLVEEYLKLKSEGMNDTKILNELKRSSGKDIEIVEGVYEDLKNSNSVLDNIPLPKCPACSECPLTDSCNTSRQFRLSRKIYRAMKEKNIRQRDVSTLH